MGRLDTFVVWLVTIIVVPGVVCATAIEEPIFERCTGMAAAALERADPHDLDPPPALLPMIAEEAWHPEFGFHAARWSFWLGCAGEIRLGLGARLNTIPVGWWMHVRFSERELIGLYVSQSYMGKRMYGFSTAARYCYGRELNELNPDQLRCLARRVRAPNSSGFACGGK